MLDYQPLEEAAVEEAGVLESIYGSAVAVDLSERCSRAWIPDPSHPQHILLTAHLPAAYPSTTPPVAEVQCSWSGSTAFEEAVESLSSRFIPGEPVLYLWIERLKEVWEEVHAAHSAEESAEEDDSSSAALNDALQSLSVVEQSTDISPRSPQTSRPALEDGAVARDMRARITHGPVLLETKSKFQGHAARVESVEEVDAMVSILLENNAIRRATHNVMVRLEVRKM